MEYNREEFLDNFLKLPIEEIRRIEKIKLQRIELGNIFYQDYLNEAK